MIKLDPQFRRADANDDVKRKQISRCVQKEKVRCQEKKKGITRSKGYPQ
jgi:hypothetical protein